jgi:prolyl-tRNA synthetase
MVLAMTHEEAVTDLARHHLSSYKQMPFMVYQFQLKFRDEPRARGGLVRVREFTMKDAYSFHRDDQDLDTYYRKAYVAYERIFSRVGVKPIVVQSDTGIMGGKVAHEFMLETEFGEDYLVLSEDGSYSANQEIATFQREQFEAESQPLEKVATPGKKSIEDVSSLLGVEAKDTAKCVFYEFERDGKRQLALVLLRGDLEAGDVKIRNHLKATWVLPAQEDFIRSCGFITGYASPVGIAAQTHWHLLADASISPQSNYVMGANEEDFHLKNARPDRDFALGVTGDFAKADAGHRSPDGKSLLRATRGIEIGNIFKLGTKFSESMNCRFLDEAGKQQPAVMGCYGIGVGRLMAAVVENSHDDFGPIWPESITPYQVH